MADDGRALLFVDDDEVNRELLARRLERRGFRLRRAASAPWNGSGDKIDLVLLDLEMP